MKKKNKKRRQRTRVRKPKDPTIKFSTVNPPSDLEKFKTAILETAANSVAEFPEMLETVREQFRTSHPLGIMASFATYGLLKNVTNNGKHQKALPNIEQYHAELLQAVLLTIPLEEWGKQPLTPDVMQTVFDIAPKLSETFFFQRVLAGQKVKDEEKIAVLSLQERIRFHTHAVRNWGYFSEVVKITTELYGTLDEDFSAHHGFSISDLVRLMESVIAEYERRVNEHSRILQKVQRGKNTRQMVKLYYENVPDLIGNPEEMIAELPPGIKRKGMLGFLMAHLDLRLHECSTYQSVEVATLTGHAPEMVETILRAISLPLESLVDTKPEYLFLNNPVWVAPSIDLGESFFIPMPQAFFSHINLIIAKLGETAGLQKELERARARFLESKLGEVLKTALPSATISTNLKWRWDDQEFENDCLVIIDRMVVIAEAKSSRLTPEGLRGAPDRVKRHIQELVLEPSVQSSRLEKLIVDAQNGDEKAGTTVRELGIDPFKVDRVIRLSVTLDDLSILSSAEGEFKRIGWIPVDHDLAPTISIADLICLVDILDNPVFFLHYLSERRFLQKSFDIIGDEMDFLGLYLETGFNLSEIEKNNDVFVATGLSELIDHYYDSRDAGVKLPKPSIKLRPLFNTIIERLRKKRPEGWTIASLHLLNLADYAEQRDLEKALAKLKGMVRKNYHDPTHVNSLQIQPKKDRKARLIFYLYPDELRPTHKAIMEQLASEALKQSLSEECCVFGRCIDNWEVPYEAICIARKRKAATEPA